VNPDTYRLIGPALRRLPPEMAHELSVRALARGLGRMLASPPADAPELAQTLWQRHFPNPVGLAAGFDKDARVPDAMLRLGFGFVEVGTVTPRPQPGNPRPRLFRLAEDRAIVNRLGFNSGGLDRAIARLAARQGRPGIVGVNLGKNRDSADAASDYAEGVRRAAPLADYLVVNVSSPNTPGLRELQRRAPLDALIQRLLAARRASGAEPPLLVKIAPDLTPEERADIAAIALSSGIDGLVIGNTTVERPPGLRSAAAHEAGGLSGPPLLVRSTMLLADMYRATGGRVRLVGVGGVASAADAYAMIRAGASLVQLYTALVYAGPLVASRINRGLAALVREDGLSSIAEAIGADHAPASRQRTPA
jgi:dihydroorotate dehydrogenase